MSRTETVPILNRRRPAPRRRLRLRMLVAAVVVAALCLTVWAVYFSSWLAADKVTVTGASTIPAADITTAAAVPVGTPMARVELDRIRASVARLPAVRTVSVRRSWPHTIVIVVTERTPVASLYHAGSWEVLDDHAVAFRAAASRPPGLPVVAVPGTVAGELLPLVTQVAAALPVPLRTQTARITADTRDSITLHLSSGDVVRWGDATESDRKVEVLTTLLAHVKASQYDVSVPGSPTTTQ
jgi:cell division protein FtsQ